MNGWEIDDIIVAQQAAFNGDSKELDICKTAYPLCYISGDYSLVIILRQFHAQTWQNEYRVYNCAPEGGETQCGITISEYNGKNSSGFYISTSIPNTDYISVSVDQNGDIAIVSNERETTTNKLEIRRKLKGIYGVYTKEMIIDTFNALSNERYAVPKPPETPKLVYDTLESKVIGTMICDKQLLCYNGNLTIDDNNIHIVLPLIEAKKLVKSLAKMDKLLQEKFYEKAVEAMLPSMLKLKNDSWLCEYEDGSDEKPLSLDEFKRRITITHISFEEDGSASIDCDDDNIFWGHSIVIDTNTKGSYKHASLEG